MFEDPQNPIIEKGGEVLIWTISLNVSSCYFLQPIRRQNKISAGKTLLKLNKKKVRFAVGSCHMRYQGINTVLKSFCKLIIQ